MFGHVIYVSKNSFVFSLWNAVMLGRDLGLINWLFISYFLSTVTKYSIGTRDWSKELFSIMLSE